MVVQLHEILDTFAIVFTNVKNIFITCWYSQLCSLYASNLVCGEISLKTYQHCDQICNGRKFRSIYINNKNKNNICICIHV